jgi:proline iminopeptidase
LGVTQWQLFGGSWGSTLSLAYAQTYPGRVSGLVLRGIFLSRPAELDWFYRDGCCWLFPEAFQAFSGYIRETQRSDLLGGYYALLTHEDPQIQIEAARHWSRWEAATMSLMPDHDRVRRIGADRHALAFARIECHYFVNGSFLPHPDHLLRGAHRLRHIPCTIVHGRYDVVTPVRSAFDLAAVWPEADLRVVADAGHAMTEPGIVHELISATRRYAR